MTDIGPGSKVICVKQGQWTLVRSGIINDVGPRFKEVCTIHMIDSEPEGDFFWLSEYLIPFAGKFDSRQFRPLDPDIGVFTALLKDIKIKGPKILEDA
jgi:hypothetical protein